MASNGLGSTSYMESGREEKTNKEKSTTVARTKKITKDKQKNMKFIKKDPDHESNKVILFNALSWFVAKNYTDMIM